MKKFFSVLLLSLAVLAFTLISFPQETLAANVCDAESVSNSISGKVSTKITFVNKSNDLIKTYWLDYQGNRTYYYQLKPGQGYTQQTYVTHPWVITDDQDNCLGVYYPDGQARTVNYSS